MVLSVGHADCSVNHPDRDIILPTLRSAPYEQRRSTTFHWHLQRMHKLPRVGSKTSTLLQVKYHIMKGTTAMRLLRQGFKSAPPLTVTPPPPPTVVVPVGYAEPETDVPATPIYCCPREVIVPCGDINAFPYERDQKRRNRMDLEQKTVWTSTHLGDALHVLHRSEPCISLHERRRVHPRLSVVEKLRDLIVCALPKRRVALLGKGGEEQHMIMSRLG